MTRAKGLEQPTLIDIKMCLAKKFTHSSRGIELREKKFFFSFSNLCECVEVDKGHKKRNLMNNEKNKRYLAEYTHFWLIGIKHVIFMCFL